MTAEISIVNKSAVAMAADSAVTISVGQKYEKIFETADKLFQLSAYQPIGIMIYNSMSFMEMPFPTLIKEFREKNETFETVKDAGECFLQYLNKIGQESPEKVLDRSSEGAVVYLLNVIRDFTSSYETIRSAMKGDPDGFEDRYNKLIMDEILNYASLLKKYENAKFVGGDRVPNFSSHLKKKYAELVGRLFPSFSNENKAALVDLCGLVMKSALLSDRITGVVLAGFGEKDRFPTLVSYEIDGMVGGRLKYIENIQVDIDRDGQKAAVVPFAQKDMVERFVYGLDDEVIDSISEAARTGINEFDGLLKNHLSLNDFQSAIWDVASPAGKNAYIEKLREDAIAQIKRRSQKNIEDMVEFMPKPEMARMAESLIELTSIKRRVTRGMETVGGPIDVAVISREDGFVWVKRKHYFPEELNYRYKLRTQTKFWQGERDVD